MRRPIALLVDQTVDISKFDFEFVDKNDDLHWITVPFNMYAIRDEPDEKVLECIDFLGENQHKYSYIWGD